jgi:multidrug efflux system outer membrane protein
MKGRASFASLTLAAALAGCTVGPDYQRPALDAPAAYAWEAKDAQETANTAWWRQFQDPVLDGLIDEALEKNRNVKIAAANVEQAAAVLTRTRSPLFPQASYGAGAYRQKGSEMAAAPWLPNVPNPQANAQLAGSASWEIDLWGKIRRQSEAAQAGLAGAEEARRGVILSLVASVAGGYLQLRGLDEQLAISRRTLKTYDESVRLFELQFKYGQVGRMNVEQARTQLETAAATIPGLELQIVETENALSLLLGRHPGPIARGKSIHELALPSVPAGIPSEVLENRPDVRRAEQGLIAANAQIGAAKALYFPAISLTGSLGTLSGDLSNLFKGPAGTWSYAGSITGPLFAAGAIRGQVRQAKAAREAALLAYENAIESAFADVENALASRQKLTLELEARARLVKATSEYERLALLQYNGGYAPYSTVLQAQEKLFPAELDLVRARTGVFSSLVTIYKVMGGGWVAEATATSPVPEPAPR